MMMYAQMLKDSARWRGGKEPKTFRRRGGGNYGAEETSLVRKGCDGKLAVRAVPDERVQGIL